MSYDQYDLFAETDKHITRKRFKTTRNASYYPSEASVQMYDETGDLVTIGKCLRAAYFRLSGEFEATPPDARAEFIFAQGHAVEDILVGLWKEMGIWVANSVKFVIPDINVSGELDGILMEPGSQQTYGVEVKSFYGYHAEKEIMGNKYQQGNPKWSHLLQTLVYLWHFHDKGLPYFRIVYFARDSVKRRTFKVELHKEGDSFYPKVEGRVIKSFTVNDIIARYKKLDEHVKNGVIPSGDFELQYSDEKIERLFAAGKVAKTKYEKWKKGKLKDYEYIGDWECSYCPYKNVCWDTK